MKAGVLFADRDIRCVEVPTPEITENELLVRVHRTGICGSDVPRVQHKGAHFYPIVLGHEFSGEVVAMGEKVKGFSIGDRVAGVPLLPCMECPDCQKGNYSLCKNYSFIGSRQQGSFAQFVALPARNAVKFEPTVSYDQGAFFEPATVALHGVRCAGYVGGKDVAVLGGGTIGLFTMQWCKIFGAKSVTVVDISDARLALAKELGCDYTVNTAKEPLPQGKYDFVFETAGQPATTLAAFEAAGNKATVGCIGNPHKDVVFTARQWENLHRKELKVTGTWMSYSAPFPGEEWTLTAHYFATGQLKFHHSLIYKQFPLERIGEAFDLFLSPGGVGGKVMIDCSGE